MASCGKYADMTVAPAALSFEAVEGWKFITPSQYIMVTKASAGRDPYWTASAEGAWIRVSPTHNWGFGRIRVNCETKDLQPGLYVGAIVIDSGVQIDLPRIPVILTVRPKVIADTDPPLDELPPEYDFPPEEPEQELPPETDGNGNAHDPDGKPSEGQEKGLWSRILDVLWSLIRALFDRQ